MNSGAEAVETAVKLARKWSYEVKGISENAAKSLFVKITSMEEPQQSFLSLMIRMRTKIMDLYSRIY
jgi:acetylornithine/succinyldiaminopimelate/putrescine aminotransferase